MNFRQTLDTNLTNEWADVLALALPLPFGQALTLTDIRSLGINTTQEDYALLVGTGLLVVVVLVLMIVTHNIQQSRVTHDMTDTPSTAVA